MAHVPPKPMKYDTSTYFQDKKVYDNNTNQPITLTGVYVLSKEGKLYINDYKKGVIHHNFFLNEAPIACAGELSVISGKITNINNNSGHYK